MAVRVLAANIVIPCSSKAKIRKNAWTRPTKGILKLNVDVGFDSDLLKGTVGAVIRDHKGRFVAAANGKFDFCMDSFTAEVLAVRFGMNPARSAGGSKLVIESDNADVVMALQEGNSASSASAIFDDCYFIAQDFAQVSYEHCNRESNDVAHELARLVRFFDVEVWLDAPPGVLNSLLVNDVTILKE